MTKTDQLKEELNKAKVFGFITICPRCEAILEDYECDLCRLRAVKVDKKDHIIELCIKYLI